MPRKDQENPSTPATPDFETSLEQLETLVRQLEQGDLKLDQALAAFEEGVRLSRHCQQALQNAEQRVQQLLAESPDERAGGEPRQAPFSTEDDRV